MGFMKQETIFQHPWGPHGPHGPHGAFIPRQSSSLLGNRWKQQAAGWLQADLAQPGWGEFDQLLLTLRLVNIS